MAENGQAGVVGIDRASETERLIAKIRLELEYKYASYIGKFSSADRVRELQKGLPEGTWLPVAQLIYTYICANRDALEALPPVGESDAKGELKVFERYGVDWDTGTARAVLHDDLLGYLFGEGVKDLQKTELEVRLLETDDALLGAKENAGAGCIH